MNAMLVAWLKMRAHDNISESDRRLHGQHNAGGPGSAEVRQDLGEEAQEEVQAGHSKPSMCGAAESAVILVVDNDTAKTWFRGSNRFFAWCIDTSH
jgi:hypothetical protein